MKKSFILISLSLLLLGAKAQLSGPYTIGGSHPDYTTVQKACDDLYNVGVSGPVTFLIADGVYNEAVLMKGDIHGASATNLITFTSASGNADSVKIQDLRTTWTLFGVSHLRFRDLTIGTLVKGEKAVFFVENCSNIEFYRCNLYADANATTDPYIPVYYNNSVGKTCLTDVKFIKNNIKGGYVNICLFSDYAVGEEYMGSVTIDSNIMTEGYTGGLARYSGSSEVKICFMYFPSISYNTIIGRASIPRYQYGICFGNVSMNPFGQPSSYDVVDQMVNNKITLQTTKGVGTGIWMGSTMNYYSSLGREGAGRPCLLANNEIIHNSPNCSSYGICGEYPRVNIINNSIYLKNNISGEKLYGMHLYNPSTTYGIITIQNNNIVVLPKDAADGYPMYFTDGAQYATSAYKIIDYNNYYSSGGFIGFIFGSGNISDLTSWRSITTQDTGSANRDPMFINPANNLKVYGFSLTCPRISTVLKDIENTTRRTPNTIMGAYEFIPYVSYDIQPYAIVTPSAVASTGIGEPVSIRLMNHGTTTITAATINWKFNGASKTFNWTGSLASGNTVVVPMDTIIPIAGNNTLEFITSLPNGQIDTMRFNDTLLFSFYACDSMLNGNYTVGTGGDFATIDDAFSVLHMCGMNGAITFKFITGLYPPLSLSGSINGISAINTITFTSATGNASNVTIGSTTVASNAVTLDGVNHLIFKNITIGLSTAMTTNGVELKGMCENLLFQGCTIRTYSTATNANYSGVKYNSVNASPNFLKNVSFINNTIDGGYYNFYFNYAAGSSSNMSSSGMSVVIDNNVMTNAYYYGIYSNYYARFQSMSHNTIISRTSGSVSTSWYGIYLNYYNNVEEIVGNKIRSTYASITSPRGIYINSYFNYTAYSGSGTGLIANNEIILHGACISASYNVFCGIYVYNTSSTVNLYHNSIYLYRTAATTTYGSGIFTYTTNTLYPINNKNNNLVTSLSSGVIATVYPYYVAAATYCTSAYGERDYNNYFNTNSATIAYTGGARTLATLKSTHSQDAGSTNINPSFAAAPSDLKIISGSSFLCPVVTKVPADITGVFRLTYTNNQGCYAKINPYDASLTAFVSPVEGVVSSISTPISVKLANFGTLPLTNVKIGWYLNGVLHDTLLTGLNLTQCQDTVIGLGAFTPASGVLTTITAFSYLPNGNADLYRLNDTVSVNVFVCDSALNGTYTVGSGKDFANVNDVYAVLHFCGVSAPVTFLLDAGNYGSIWIADTFPGASTTNTVTFTSASGDSTDVVFSSTTGAAITVQNVAHLILHKATIDVRSGLVGIEFIGRSENIEISNCDIKASTTATVATYRGISRNNLVNPLSNIRILNNNIDGGYYGIYLDGSSTTERNTDVVINNNRINSLNSGIYTLYTNTNQLNGNIITRHTSSTYAYYGMYFNTCYAKEIVGNKIRIDSSTNDGGFYGTSFGAESASSRLLIANNEMIFTYYTSGLGKAKRGFYIASGQDYTDFYHNSILLKGVTGSTACFYLQSPGSNVNIKNNNFINLSGPSSSSTTYSFYTSNQTDLTTTKMDYNNYYTVGTKLMYATSAITDLDSWKLTTSKDSNSTSILPNFIDPNYSNLHTDGLAMLCVPLIEVPNDILDSSRTTTITNMGCYHDFIPVAYTYDTLTICDNELPYTYRDSSLASAGSYQIKFTSGGNDTLVTLTLYVNPSYSGNDTVTLCSNQLPLNYGDSAFATAGSHNVYFKTTAGCDSLIVLRLYVNPTYSHTDTIIICNHELPYSYGDSIFATAGSYTVYFASVNGCDSIVSLKLFAINCQGSDIVDICSTDLPYSYGDSVFTSGGIYQVVFKGYTGLDSIIALTLRVHSTYNRYDTVSICSNELPYNYGDSTFAMAGDYAVHFSSLYGCDSLISLKLYVNPTYAFKAAITICNNELPYRYGDSLFTKAGKYDVHFKTINGCDSLIGLTLNVNPTYSNKAAITICANELPYRYGDSLFTKAGKYDVHFKTINGCDSLIGLTLNVNPTYSNKAAITICNNELPYRYGDSLFTKAGKYDVHFKTINGCDSLIGLTLNVNPTYANKAAITICDNELPYRYGDSTFTKAGKYDVHFKTINGCDSLIGLTLNVNPTYSNKAAITICANELPYRYGDSLFTKAGKYDVHFKTINGCDSLIGLTLNVNPTYSNKAAITICNNELPYRYGDSLFTKAGKYDVHFKTINGCDSLIGLTLNVNPTYAFKAAITICDNELPYRYGDSTFHIGTISGIYPIHYTLPTGCDSLITLTLNVNPTYNHKDTITICDNELPYSYKDSTFITAGNYNVHFSSINGCDSLFTLQLYVNPTYNDTDAITICDSELPYSYGDSIFVVGTISGIYPVHYTLPTGCDSLITLTLNVNPIYNHTDTNTICDNELPYSYGDSIFTQEGDYVVYFYSILGCDSIINLRLNVVNGVPTAPLQVFGDTVITTSGVYTYYVDPVATADSYVWTISNADWAASSTTETVDVTISNAGSGIISVKAVNICGESDAVSLAILSSVNIIEIQDAKCVLGQNIPNPTSVTAKIPYAIPQDGKVVFNIMSINGQVLYKEAIQASAGTHYLELNTQTLSNGIYYYSMEYQGQRLVKKMTIQK